MKINILFYFLVILTLTNCRGIRIDCNKINFSQIMQIEKDSLVEYFVNQDGLNGFNDLIKLGIRFKDSSELLQTKKLYQNDLKKKIDSISLTPIDLRDESALSYLLAIKEDNYIHDSIAENEGIYGERFTKKVFLVLEHKDNKEIYGCLLVGMDNEDNDGLSSDRTIIHSFLKSKKIVVIKENWHNCDICAHIKSRDLYSRSKEIWMIDKSNLFLRR